MTASTPAAWLREKSKFGTIAPALKRSLGGGLVSASSLTDEEQAIYDEAVEADVLTREERFSCRGRACDKTWTTGNVPNTCICGETYETPIDTPDSIVYFTFGVEDLFQSAIPDSTLDGIADLHVTRDSVDELSVSDVNMTGAADGITLHVSPEFSFDAPAVKVFSESDVFLDWSHVPHLVAGDLHVEDLEEAPMRPVNVD